MRVTPMRRSFESALENVAARLKGQTVKYAEAPHDVCVLADHGQIAQVLEILVDNALDVTDAAGISIRVDATPKDVVSRWKTMDPASNPNTWGR